MAHNREITPILATLARAYPRFELTPETIAVYCRLLADLDAGLLEAAAIDHAAKSQWFPSVYELRRAVVEIQKRGHRVPASEEAWYELLNAPAGGLRHEITEERDDEGRMIVLIHKHQFSHPLVEHVARNLGWPARFWTDSLVSDRSKFIAAYQSELERQTGEALSLPEVREYTQRLGGGKTQPVGRLLAGILEKMQ